MLGTLSLDPDHPLSDLLSFVVPSAVRNPPNGMGRTLPVAP